MIDSYKRKINYLRISITDLCNLRCKYCMPKNGISKIDHNEVLRLEEIEKITKVFVDLGINKIRITGGEPLVRRGVLNLIEKIGKIDKVKDFALTTNGLLLKKYAKDLKNAGLNRVNISLDTLNEEKYREITRGGNLKDLIKGIKEAKKVGLTPIKLNTVLIGGFNENEIYDFVNLTKNEEIDVRFIELMPIGEAKGWSLDKFIPNSRVLECIKDLKEIKRDDISSPANYYKLSNGKGKVGFINPISCKFCDNCNRVRLTCDGKLKLCLHSNEEIDLKTPLRNGEDLKEIIINSINKKPKSHHLEDGEYIKRNMVAIGG
ncbi:GTP 3',8-cyclase MoaA [Tepidibacter formicigenes]|jgi:cyclic pyranopterin phosphate synthase|uniref:GTP 3',8-cyclase n=1 Tax=Tepidibacter formicigenes DSM 15518 TaxID=1123349 RepID=A0A1M6QGE8_9FIRM|nr:GTP 3',8-cyclase MoaA [Tepidibacter formicigenes]SHK19117.1 cyclic pyranopterin phosphate synthase [Tepidibacter formicigenes DSM 15518]